MHGMRPGSGGEAVAWLHAEDLEDMAAALQHEQGVPPFRHAVSFEAWPLGRKKNVRI